MKLHRFGASDPLSEFSELPQAQYLRCYLTDLLAKTVIEEEHYFDRDYLDELATYYSRVARPTPNHCRRFHFFDQEFGLDDFRRALNGDASTRAMLEIISARWSRDHSGKKANRPRSARFECASRRSSSR